MNFNIPKKVNIKPTINNFTKKQIARPKKIFLELDVKPKVKNLQIW